MHLPLSDMPIYAYETCIPVPIHNATKAGELKIPITNWLSQPPKEINKNHLPSFFPFHPSSHCHVRYLKTFALGELGSLPEDIGYRLLYYVPAFIQYARPVGQLSFPLASPCLFLLPLLMPWTQSLSIARRIWKRNFFIRLVLSLMYLPKIARLAQFLSS